MLSENQNQTVESFFRWIMVGYYKLEFFREDQI